MLLIHTFFLLKKKKLAKVVPKFFFLNHSSYIIYIHLDGRSPYIRENMKFSYSISNFIKHSTKRHVFHYKIINKLLFKFNNNNNNNKN
jgi:hypothetical protein